MKATATTHQSTISLVFLFVFCFERMIVQQLNYKDLSPELKCGLFEHHLKCHNNHQHVCGHIRKEEEEEEQEEEEEEQEEEEEEIKR